MTIDCVSRADALDCVNWGYSFSDIYKKINELPSVTPQEPKWIPVSERYPQIEDEYKYFLVTDEKGKVSVQEFFLSLDEEPQPYFSGMINVIAWMPLPEPYKAESEET